MRRPARPGRTTRGDRRGGAGSTRSTTLPSRHRVRAWFGDGPLERAVIPERLAAIDPPRRPLPDASVTAPVRFLGKGDATLLVHARRAQILPEHYRDLVFHIRRPHSVNTVLIDGQVAGTWTITGDRVVVEPFDGVPQRLRDELDGERAALEAFVT
ncbi:MAG: winged helix DNA-binding domain-containing protein [Actinobacteria bacterium]|nr:winged helix DNA-binding domain-containing protein [Actinomycetota bacterium]